MRTSYDNYHKQYYLKHRQAIIAKQKQYNRKHYKHTKLNNICWYINTVANLEQLVGFKSLINNRLQEIKEDK